jgi:osmotically-inducible protein OsmY
VVKRGGGNGTSRWIAALIAAATLAVSCATLQPRSADGANEVLADAVYSKLNADPVYYFRHVNVSVDHGVAHLSGYVWSTDAIYRARYVAQSVPGISGVVTSQLELERNGRSDGVTR